MRRRINARLCDGDSVEDRRPMKPSRVKCWFVVVLVLLLKALNLEKTSHQVLCHFVAAKEEFVFACEIAGSSSARLLISGGHFKRELSSVAANLAVDHRSW